MKEVVLPSGRKLSVQPAPFKEAKALYQALATEFLRADIDGEAELANLIKNVMCLAISSPRVEAALEPCLRRCTYNSLRISEESFESEEAREDYLDICIEVSKENLTPFTKSLFAGFKGLMAVVGTVLPSRPIPTQRGSSLTSDSAIQATETSK